MESEKTANNKIKGFIFADFPGNIMPVFPGKNQIYSFFKDFTGLAMAALTDCQLIVISAMIIAINAERKKISGPMFMR